MKDLDAGGFCVYTHYACLPKDHGIGRLLQIFPPPQRGRKVPNCFAPACDFFATNAGIKPSGPLKNSEKY
jgi:hypothetical protein